MNIFPGDYVSLRNRTSAYRSVEFDAQLIRRIFHNEDWLMPDVPMLVIAVAKNKVSTQATGIFLFVPNVGFRWTWEYMILAVQHGNARIMSDASRV